MITNYLSTGGFQVSIKRLPGTEFYTQKASIPGVSSNPTKGVTPLNPYFEPGDDLTYEDLNLEFIIDEDMNNYIDILDWIKSNTSPETSTQYKKEGKTKSQISIIVLNSAKRPVVEITYYDCFPISLSEITLDSNNSDVQYAKANAVFKYNYKDVIKL